MQTPGPRDTRNRQRQIHTKPVREQQTGNVTQAAATGASPYVGDGMAINRRQSPSSSVTHITAPILILSDTGDFRVPIAQSFGLYRALVDNHVKTEFYAIPVGG